MKDTASIVFTGDIGFDRYMAGKWNDPELLDKTIIDYFKSADHVVANVEGAMMSATDDVTGRGIYFHAMDPEASVLLEKIGADIWDIGNNHIMDGAKEGLESTLRKAGEMNCVTVGAGRDIFEASKPLILDEAGGIGIVAIAYYPECIPASENGPGCFSWDEFDLIGKTIEEIKKTCRWAVIVVHGGEEFAAVPMPYIRERYLRYLDMGADVLVCHHPHVPQNYETFENGKMIFYSLGNFIFDTDYQRAQYGTDRGILLKLTFTENGFTYDALGMKLERGEEHLRTYELPDIFTDINEKEYMLLTPLSAQVLIAAEKRRQIYLEPEKYKDASDEAWDKYFMSEDIDDYVKDQYMDFAVIKKLSIKNSDSWKKSSLESVKEYMLKLLR